MDHRRAASYSAAMPKPRLLLLPGLLCDARLWQDQAASLSSDHHCIIADLTQDDSIGAMAARAIAAVEGPFALAGLSMGGYVALEVMRQAADRVTRLALLDTSARPDTPEQARRRRGLISLSRKGAFRGVTPRLLPELLHPAHLATPVAETVMAMAERVGRDAFIRQQLAILSRPDSRPDLPRIAVPSLVGVGSGDRLTPPLLAEEIAAAIPGARLVFFQKSGHLPPLEEPEAVTVALRDWLRRES